MGARNRILQDFQLYNISSHHFSEFEFIVGYLLVVWLGEFVLESRNEFWVDLDQELSNLGNSITEIRFFVFGEFFHFLGPAVCLLELLT